MPLASPISSCFQPAPKTDLDLHRIKSLPPSQRLTGAKQSTSFFFHLLSSSFIFFHLLSSSFIFFHLLPLHHHTWHLSTTLLSHALLLATPSSVLTGLRPLPPPCLTNIPNKNPQLSDLSLSLIHSLIHSLPPSLSLTPTHTHTHKQTSADTKHAFQTSHSKAVFESSRETEEEINFPLLTLSDKVQMEESCVDGRSLSWLVTPERCQSLSSSFLLSSFFLSSFFLSSFFLSSFLPSFFIALFVSPQMMQKKCSLSSSSD